MNSFEIELNYNFFSSATLDDVKQNSDGENTFLICHSPIKEVTCEF